MYFIVSYCIVLHYTTLRCIYLFIYSFIFCVCNIYFVVVADWLGVILRASACCLTHRFITQLYFWPLLPSLTLLLPRPVSPYSFPRYAFLSSYSPSPCLTHSAYPHHATPSHWYSTSSLIPCIPCSLNTLDLAPNLAFLLSYHPVVLSSLLQFSFLSLLVWYLILLTSSLLICFYSCTVFLQSCLLTLFPCITVTAQLLYSHSVFWYGKYRDNYNVSLHL